MSYLGRLQAQSTPYTSRLRYQAGAQASRTNNSFYDQYFQMKMAQMQMQMMPQGTVTTHENQKTYNGHGFLGKVFGGALDFTKALVSGLTGKQIGGYTETITTFGGGGMQSAGIGGCFSQYSNNNGTMQMMQSQISQLQQAMGQQLNPTYQSPAIPQQSSSSSSQSSSATHLNNIKTANPDWTITEDNGTFKATRNGYKDIIASSLTDLEAKLRTPEQTTQNPTSTPGSTTTTTS